MSDLFNQGPGNNTPTQTAAPASSAFPTVVAPEPNPATAPDKQASPATDAWNPFEAPAPAPAEAAPAPLPVPSGLAQGGVVRQSATGQIGLVVAMGKLENDTEGRVRDAVVVAWLTNVSHPILAGEFEVL